jgi:hypothetical protein
LVDGAEDWIVLAGGEGSHVEDAAHSGPATSDIALAAVLT